MLCAVYQPPVAQASRLCVLVRVLSLEELSFSEMAPVNGTLGDAWEHRISPMDSVRLKRCSILPVRTRPPGNML